MKDTRYMRSSWRAEDMPLVEFLRKTGMNGDIHPKLKKRYNQALKEAEGGELLEESLEAWANNAETYGEVALAALYLSRYNDRYYGQWVLMNVPFRSLEDLKPEGLDKVPDHLYYQTMAFLLRRERWENPAAVRAELELHAFREYHVKNILAMLSPTKGSSSSRLKAQGRKILVFVGRCPHKDVVFHFDNQGKKHSNRNSNFNQHAFSILSVCEPALVPGI